MTVKEAFNKFNDEFIEPNYDKVSEFISKDDFIRQSIKLYNISIGIEKTLKNHNIILEEKDKLLVVYNDPFHVSLIINLPLCVLDIGYFIENEKILFEVKSKNIQYDIKRRFVTDSSNSLEKYLVGFLSAHTLIYETVEKNSESV